MFPYFKQIDNVAIIGLAGGTMARQYYYLYPKIKIDGVEIDPKVVDVGNRYFDMKHENLAVYIMDGRQYLSSTDKKYDLIIGDAYRQPYIPWHLVTKEFFELSKSRLNQDGIIALNVGSVNDESLVLNRVANTLALTFKHVYIMKVPSTMNYLVYASDREFDALKIDGRQLNGLRLKMWKVMRDNTKESEYDPKVGIFTDDKAPVEILTDKMIFDYART
jgi:spermidine synthase